MEETRKTSAGTRRAVRRVAERARVAAAEVAAQGRAPPEEAEGRCHRTKQEEASRARTRVTPSGVQQAAITTWGIILLLLVVHFLSLLLLLLQIQLRLLLLLLSLLSVCLKLPLVCFLV